MINIKSFPIMRTHLLLLSMMILSILWPLPIQAALQPYRAVYSLKWHGVPVGSSTHTVQNIGPQIFSAEILSKPIVGFLPFKAHEKSRFKIYREQVRPLYYEYQFQEKSKKKKGEIWFDWQRKKVHETIEMRQTKTLPLTESMLDKISLYFQIQSDLIHQKSALDYTVIDPEKIKSYHFSIVGEEDLLTPLGLLKTVIIEHISPNQERHTKIWLAKERAFLIVKLQQKKNGKLVAESLIKSYQGFPPS
jgi:hypothetical protein